MIGLIENAIVARVRLAVQADVLGYTLGQVDSYREELADDINEQLGKLPAVWVVFSGAQGQDYGDTTRWAPARFVVLCAARNARNERAQRHGAAGVVGSYQIAQDVRALLKNHSLGLPIEALQPTSIRPLIAPALVRAKISVVAVEFATSWAEGEPTEHPALVAADNTAHPGEPGYPRLPIGNFQAVELTWDMPPIAGVDARDTIHPPQ